MPKVKTKYGVETKVREKLPKTTAEYSVEIINGILLWVENSGWKKGWRNDASVDLTLACYMLNLDPCDLMKHAIEGFYESPIEAKNNFGNFKARHDIVVDYLDEWMRYPTSADVYFCDGAFWKAKWRDSEGKAEPIVVMV